MKLFLLTLLVAFAAADVSHIVGNADKDAPIIRQEQDVSPDGSFQWAFETGNGISAQEQGALKNPQSENAAEEVQGKVSWISPEGEQISFQYVADEDGYHPVGDHLPTPPPIPEAIQRALQYIAEHPPKEELKN